MTGLHVRNNLFKNLTPFPAVIAGLMVATTYILLALIATYPLITIFNSAVLGGGDTVQNIWNLWWIQRAMREGNVFPYYTSMIYYPKGVSLAYHPLGLVNGWLGVLLQIGFGLNLVTTYNLIVLFTFVTSGLFTYLLVHRLTNNKMAAFVAGLIFTFSPFRMSRVFFGNLEMFSSQFIPLSMLFFLRLFQTRQRRYALLTAISIALTFGISLYLGFGTIILVCIFLFLYLAIPDLKQLTQRLRQEANNLFLLGSTTFILVLPFILPMVWNYSDFQDQSNQATASESNSADLLSFVIPDNSTNPIFKRVIPHASQTISNIYAQFYGNPAEKSVFIGYITLIVVITTLFLPIRVPYRQNWFIIAGVFFILSLGSTLRIGGQEIIAHLPYEWLNKLPLLSFGRVPSRFAIFLMLAITVMSGYGLMAFAARYNKFRWFTPIIGMLIFVEFLIIPIRVDARFENVPEFYYQQMFPNDSGAILDIPIDLVGAQGPAGEYMLYQTIHQKPIIPGYISRTPAKATRIFEDPFLRELRVRIYQDNAPYQLDNVLLLSSAYKTLSTLGANLVILHKDMVSPQDASLIQNKIDSILQKPFYESERLTVWKIKSGGG